MRSSQKTRKKFKFSPMVILKAFGLALIVGIGLLLIVSVVLTSFNTVRSNFLTDEAAGVQSVGFGMAPQFTQGDSGRGESATAPSAVPDMDSAAELRAEDLEITEYYAHIRTARYENACSVIEDIRGREGVVFQNSDRGDERCLYVIKVENRYAASVRAEIEALSPRTFQERKETVLSTMQDLISEEEILRLRLEATEDTLGMAQRTYEEVARIAAEQRDVETLARIVDRQMQLIERMTRERMNIMREMERLEKRRSDLLERTGHTVFTVRVDRSVIIDGRSLKDTWKSETRRFVREFNDVTQGMVIGLLLLLLRMLQYTVYLLVVSLILLYAVKHGWVWAKRIWKG